MSWFSATLQSSVVIDAPPQKCLDFDRYSEWHTDFIQSTKVTRPPTDEAVRGLEAKPGDKLTILAGNFVGHAVLLENEPGVFSYAYTGRKLGLDAVRTFRFTRDDSSEEGSRTLFTHFASWEGYAAVMFWSWSPIRAHVRGLFEGFHNDLKRAAEN
ncbi:hypothetical protein MBLNU13_g04861t2 [Cladosporium sp. NU13]